MKCAHCKKKLKLLEEANKCRCGGVYCSTHLFSGNHACKFDYQAFGKEQLEKQNIKVVSSKGMEKI